MKILTIIAILLISSLSGFEAKVYTRCQLSKELIRNNFSRTFLSNWVCLIENASGRSTSKVTGPLPNGSFSFGLFQINSKEWCRKGRKGGNCNMKCEDFINDDLTDDIRCAKKIYDQRGFQGWPGWQNRCRGKPLPDVSRCP